MKFIQQTDDKFTIQFSRDEFGLLCGCGVNVLEPSIMGKDYDLTSSTGWTLELAEHFQKKICLAFDALNNSVIIHTLQKEEIIYLMKILDDSIQYIDWEFQTLTGYTLDEARTLLSQLRYIYEITVT